MAIKHFCDKCGHEIPQDFKRTYVRPVDQDGDPALWGEKKEYELCIECKDDLQAWLESAQREEGQDG